MVAKEGKISVLAAGCDQVELDLAGSGRTSIKAVRQPCDLSWIYLSGSQMDECIRHRKCFIIQNPDIHIFTKSHIPLPISNL